MPSLVTAAGLQTACARERHEPKSKILLARSGGQPRQHCCTKRSRACCDVGVHTDRAEATGSDTQSTTRQVTQQKLSLKLETVERFEWIDTVSNSSCRLLQCSTTSLLQIMLRNGSCRQGVHCCSDHTSKRQLRSTHTTAVQSIGHSSGNLHDLAPA